MNTIPSGTVTFLFTDIEGSTRLWEHFPHAMPAALARHNDIIRQAVEQQGGYVFQVIGDAFWAAFHEPTAALAAALAAQRALFAEQWQGTNPLRVRMALHIGPASPVNGSYIGPTVSKLACLVSAGHGGQILLSAAAHESLSAYLTEDVGERDMGERRLKDLPQPEHIYQLLIAGLPTEFPPLKTLDTRRTNLPSPATSFVGREQELAVLTMLLRRTDIRLLTLSGVGGSGKTRLAVQLANNLLDEYEDGIYFVNLTATADPALVIATIAQTLGVKETAGESISGTLKRYLSDRQIMLLLDNFEQVVDAALDIADLLTSAPRLKVLVTTREALRIYGEQEYNVPTLALPNSQLDATAAMDSAAVSLFVQRAQAVNYDFTLTAENTAAIAEICTRLDGLPLAIELAAAHVRRLSPAEILQRWQSDASMLEMLNSQFRNPTTHQHSLRATFDWSYGLLNPDEQTLFARLSAFASGATIEAIEAVCTAPESTIYKLQSTIYDALFALVEKSLVQKEELGSDTRFSMLTVIREYAQEKLTASGEEEAVLRAHAEYYTALATKAEPALRGPQAADWLLRLEQEHDNLRAALTWAANHAPAMLLRLVAPLRPFWLMHSHLSEGRYWLDIALAKAANEDPGLRAKSAAGAGILAAEHGDYRRARELFELSLNLSRQVGDIRGIANALTNLGLAADEQGDHDAARALLEQSFVVWQQVEGGELGQASILGNLGFVVQQQGDLATARRLQEQSLAIRRRLDDGWGIAIAEDNLGGLDRAEGHFVAARQHFIASLKLRREFDHKRGIATSLERFAGLAAAQGQGNRAARLLGAEEALRETIGASIAPADQADYANLVTTARQSLSESDFHAAWMLGRNMGLEQAIDYALNDDAPVQSSSTGSRYSSIAS